MNKWFVKYRPLKLAIIFALYFLLFILLINPFRNYRGVAEGNLINAVLAATIVFFLIFAIYFFLQRINLIFARLFSIPVVFFISLYFLYSTASTVNLYEVLIMAAAASIVPVFFELIFSEKANQSEHQNVANKTKELLHLKGTNQLDSLSVLPENIVVIEANDNYVNINYLEENKIKKKMLRATLKNIGLQLENEIGFEKIHRSVIINKNYLKVVIGKSQQKKVVMEHLQNEFPVSRHFDLDKISKL